MTQEVTDLHALLLQLVGTCLDGEEGYRSAADHVQNSELEGIFREYQNQRQSFASELHEELRRLGHDSPGHGTVPAALHRAWISMESLLTGSRPALILAACETGEVSAIAEFQRVVDSKIPGQTRALVTKQTEKVRQAHAHIMRLRERVEEGTMYRKDE